MTMRIAHCHCRDLELRCLGEPTKVSLCCCKACQRRTGSAFSVAVFLRRDQVSIHGETRVFTRASASGFAVAFHFCPACGANVFWLPDRLPDRIGVALGAFEDATLLRPDQAVWTTGRPSWLDLPSDIPCHDENPIRA